MATMAYPAYDGLHRSLSRRQSLGYPATPGYIHQGPYTEPILSDYPQPSYQIYGPPASGIPMSHRLTGPSAYDDFDLHDQYYPDDRHLSMIPMSRHRRHSTVSYVARPPALDTYRHPSSLHIKFKRKGAFIAGISLAEAQSHVRLSGNESYTLHDFHADYRDRILLKVRWAGYPSLTYEIPLDRPGYDGRVSLQTLARRVSRACVHYLQANVIPIVWDRVQLHHLEEIGYGVWQPMLSTR